MEEEACRSGTGLEKINRNTKVRLYLFSAKSLCKAILNGAHANDRRNQRLLFSGMQVV